MQDLLCSYHKKGSLCTSQACTPKTHSSTTPPQASPLQELPYICSKVLLDRYTAAEGAHQSTPRNLDWPVPSRRRMQEGQMAISLSPKSR